MIHCGLADAADGPDLTGVDSVGPACTGTAAASRTDVAGRLSQDVYANRGDGQVSVPGASALLRHACGHKLANDGRDTRAVQHYLRHKNIQHTVRYTRTVAGAVQRASGVIEVQALATAM